MRPALSQRTPAPRTTARPARARGLSSAAYGIVVLLLASACGSSAGPGERTVTVLAAASLTESFDRISADFEQAHPGVTVQVSYGSSATLVQQVNQGAPAQVIALAGEAAAKPLDQQLVKKSSIFATNVLEIAVPPSNPGKVTTIADLGRPGLKVVLCAEAVPCGKAADATFSKAGVTPSVVSREVDVKATLAKVKLGESDAAVVYHSDVVGSKGSVTGVPIDATVNTSLRYPIITLSEDPTTAEFVDYVLSAQGRATLESLGLGTP